MKVKNFFPRFAALHMHYEHPPFDISRSAPGPGLLCVGVTLHLIPCLLSSYALIPPVSIQCSAVMLEYLASLLCSSVSLHYPGPLYYLSALLCSAVLLENPTLLYCLTTLLCSALLLKYPALLRVLLEYPALCPAVLPPAAYKDSSTVLL